MSLKLYLTCFVLVLAILFVPSAQSAESESALTNNTITQGQDPRDREALERRYLQALDALTKAQGDHRPAIYNIHVSLATLYKDKHEFSEAEKYYQSAYDIAKPLFGEQSDEVMKTLNHLGEVRLEQGRLLEADRSFHQALEIHGSIKDANRFDRAAILNNLAVVQHMTGNLSKSAELMRKVIGVFETDPTANEDGFGTALSNLATMLRELGTLPEAMATAQRAVSILERSKNSDGLALSLVTLSRLHLDQGNTSGAETALQRALQNVEARGQEGSPTQALIFGHLGVLYGRTGRNNEAEPLFQRSIQINQRLLGPEHPKLLDSMGAYAAFLRTTKRKGEAKKLEAYIRDHREKYRMQNPSVGNVVDVNSLMKQGSR